MWDAVGKVLGLVVGAGYILFGLLVWFMTGLVVYGLCRELAALAGRVLGAG